MRRPRILGPGVLALVALILSVPALALAQQATIPQEQLAAYGKAFVAIGKLRDDFHANAAAAQNKKPEAQQSLQEKLRQDIQAALQEHGLTEQQYNHITWVVSTDAPARAALDQLLGIAPPAPPPAAAPAAAGAAAASEAGQQAGNPHIGHVMTSFSSAPDGQGLLPTALAEAQVVIQHAGLAARNTSDLDAMKTHAGHIAHAIEPAEGARGPGKGYGLKKAASDVATHIELAAKVEGASQNITTHSVHIATAARNTVTRADEILKLVQQIQASTSATEAADLVAKINTLANQLVAGVDSNGDGRIGWQEGEGGLQHVEQHLKLMMDAEKAGQK